MAAFNILAERKGSAGEDLVIVPRKYVTQTAMEGAQIELGLDAVHLTGNYNGQKLS